METIVAAAIIALALGATYRVIADSAARYRAAEARRTALLVARSELAAVGTEIPLAPGGVSGESAGLAWRVNITSYGEDGEAGDGNPAGDLLQIAVSVSRPEGGPDLVTLQSLRLSSGS